jgi:uncharacterized RDD family membrane protein YckC
VTAVPAAAPTTHPGYAAPTPPPSYAGLATRTIAFGLDAAALNGVALLVGVLVGLGLSVLHLPSAAKAAIAVAGGVLYVVWTIGYFITFWSTTGQTPGDRMMHIRVVDGRQAQPLRPVRAALRLAGLVLAVIPLLAGVWMMLWDGRRRGLHDRIARTVVVHAAPPPAPGRR